MLTDEFDFDLPEELIAQEPSKLRGDDRLLILNAKTGEYLDRKFSDLLDFIPQDALLVFNNSKVRKARCFAKKIETDAMVEFLFLQDFQGGRVWQVLTKRGKRQKAEDRYRFADSTECELLLPDDCLSEAELQSLAQEKKQQEADSSYEQSEKFLRFEQPLTDEWFERNGHIPLPPYIKREDTPNDAQRYQNVYAHEVGSVACPTAGLHFTEALLAKMEARNIARVNITLHVGLGTFLPVRVRNVEEHKMHFEKFFISDDVAEKIEKQKADGKPVLAVGTTSLRALEGAAQNGRIKRGWQSSNIFIYPPYRFKVIDQLLTNFHTPKSTLLMLVSALAGREHILAAYQHAVQERYRFFSYGDAMLIL